MTQNLSADFSRRKSWEGEAPAEPKTAANGDWRIANGNGFDHQPEVGGYKIKAG